MKAVKIPVDAEEPIEVVDVGKRRGMDWLDLRDAIGGPCQYIERARCALTPMRNEAGLSGESFLVMVVDESGLLNGQPRNDRAVWLYPGAIHGTVLVMAEGLTAEGRDFIDLPDPDRALTLVKEVCGQ